MRYATRNRDLVRMRARYGDRLALSRHALDRAIPWTVTGYERNELLDQRELDVYRKFEEIERLVRSNPLARPAVRRRPHSAVDSDPEVAKIVRKYQRHGAGVVALTSTQAAREVERLAAAYLTPVTE